MVYNLSKIIVFEEVDVYDKGYYGGTLNSMYVK